MAPGILATQVLGKNMNGLSRRDFLKTAACGSAALLASDILFAEESNVRNAPMNKDALIIDSHIHIPSPGWNGHTSFFSSQDAAIRYLRDAGIGGAIFTTWQGVFSKTAEDLFAANEDALKLAKTYKGFLLPGANVNPLFFEESQDWLSRFSDEGHKWVGELIIIDDAVPYASAKFMKLFEICAKHNHIVQLHQHHDIIKIAESFPDMKIVCAHIPPKEVMQKLCNLKNVWLDMSGMSGGLIIGQLELALELFGHKRLLFGTDFDGYEPRAFIARVKSVVKKKDEQEDIFKNNLIRLLA